MQLELTNRSPGRAVREGDLRADVGHVDHSAGSGVLSCVDDELEGDLYLVGNVLAADLVLTEAESSAFTSRGRALAPADWADSSGAVVAWWVAEGSALFLVLVADQRSASCAAVGVLGA